MPTSLNKKIFLSLLVFLGFGILIPLSTAQAAFTLTVSKIGAGASVGVIKSYVPDASLNCGSVCTKSYATGANVQLEAIGSNFVKWGGDCGTGTGTQCMLTMDKAKNVTAEFAKPLGTFALTTSITAGDGTVGASPGAIVCTKAGGITSGTCSASINTGTTVTVFSNSSSFIDWAGDCTGSASQCILKMTKDMSVSARFKDMCTPPLTFENNSCKCNVPPNKIENGICIAPVYYNLLAPLSTVKTFDPTQENALSTYLNLMIKILIGVAAVLAMIMIVMGGIEYMTSDMVSSKEEGKKRITNAVLGLLIALGSYLLLFTINPDLLKVEPKIAATVIEYDEEEDTLPILDDSNTPLPPSGTKISGCTGSIVLVPIPSLPGKAFKACSTIAPKLTGMLTDALAHGIKLSGGGYRSAAEQIALRTRNGCPDVYNSPPSACRVATARPGRSMHETGQAFDLRCDIGNGPKLIYFDNRWPRSGFANTPATKTCFDWLKANASKYSLFNLPAENWHWSVNGH